MSMKSIAKVTNDWSCSNCTFMNSSYLNDCELCGTKNVEDDQSRACKQCSYLNQADSNKCVQCDSPLKEKKSEEQIILCNHCTFQNSKDNLICLNCDMQLKQKNSQVQFKAQKCPICLIQLFSSSEQHIKACEQSLLMIQKLKTQQEEEIKNMKQEEFEQIKPIKPKPISKISSIKPIEPKKIAGYKHDPDKIKNPITKRKICENCQLSCDQESFLTHIKICQKLNLDIQSIIKVKPTLFYLTPIQVQALQYMNITSKNKHESIRPALQKRIKGMGFRKADLEALEHYLQNYAPIIVHIHINKHMQYFLKDTEYRNQFQTGKSSGTLDRQTRTTWQNRMFDHKYSRAKDYQRVKYGTINFTNDPAGVNACKTYGNSYFLLKQDVRSRCTFSDQDSSRQNSVIGTFKYGDHILNKLSDPQLKACIDAAKAKQVSSLVVTTYKQIQIHGPIEFARDIQRLYVNKLEFNTPYLRDIVKQFSIKFGVDYELI